MVVVAVGGAGGEKREGTSFHSALHPHSWQPTTVRRWAVAVAPRAHGRSMRSASSSPSRAVAVIAEQLWEARAAAARELGSAERVDSGAPCGAACVPVRTAWAPPDPPTGAAHRRHHECTRHAGCSHGEFVPSRFIQLSLCRRYVRVLSIHVYSA